MTVLAGPGNASAGTTHPLIAQLASRHGFVELDGESFDAFVEQPGATLVVFTEDPVRYKETLDLAVIAPEIARAFPGMFKAAVLLPDAARVIAVRYGFRRWPALVLLRDGAYVGAIDGLREWDAYLAEIARLVQSAATRPPSIGIAVTGAGEACGT